MSLMKRHIESEIERMAKASGYTQDRLMNVFNEMVEDGEADLKHLETIAMEHDL